MRWALFFGLLWLGFYESAGRVVVFEGRNAAQKASGSFNQVGISSPSVAKTEFRDNAATPTGKRRSPPSFALNAAGEATALLSTQLASLQHPVVLSSYDGSRGHQMLNPGRYLVFTYGPEQGINGFGAMFQWYAAALLLAHRYNRTLVELHPLPLPRQRAGGLLHSQGSPLNGNATAALAAANAAAAEMAQVGWAAAAALAGTASDAGLPDNPRMPASARLFGRLARVNDPWKRAPLAACGGAKAGCLFHAPASLGLTVLPPDVAAALPRRRNAGLNETAVLLLARRLLNSASATSSSPAPPTPTDSATPGAAGASSQASAAAAPAVEDAELAASAIPLLDIDAEERRLFRLTRRRRRAQGENGAASAAASDAAAAVTGTLVGDDGYDPSGRAIRTDANGVKLGFHDPADAPVVRVDTIARYRDVVLALSAGLEPAQALALEQLHAIAARVAAADTKAAAEASASGNSSKSNGLHDDTLDAIDGAGSSSAVDVPYLRNAQAFADRLNATCSRIASCIAVLLAGLPAAAASTASAGAAAAKAAHNAWLCCGGSNVTSAASTDGAPSSADDTARLRQLQLRYSLQCATPSDSASDVTWPQRRQSFIDSYITAAWTSHQHGEHLRITQRRAELLRNASVAGASASASDANDPLLRPRDLVVPQTVQLQRSDHSVLRQLVGAGIREDDEAVPHGRCDAELQSWLQQTDLQSASRSPASGLQAVLTTASAASAAADNNGVATGWQRVWFPAHQAFLFRPRPSVTQLAPFTRRMALPDSNYDSGHLLHREAAACVPAGGFHSPPCGHELQPAAPAEALPAAPVPGASVGIHFRQGDALVVGWRSKAPLSAYAEQTVRAAAAMHGVSQARPSVLRHDGVWTDVPAAAAAIDAHDDGSAAAQQALRTAAAGIAASSAQPPHQPPWNWSLALASDSASARTDLPAAVALGHMELHFQDLFGPQSSLFGGGGGGGSIFGGATATARWQPAAPGSAEHVAALRRAVLLDAGDSGGDGAASSAAAASSSSFLDRGPYTKPAALLTSGAPVLTVAGSSTGSGGILLPTGAARRMATVNGSPSNASGAGGDATALAAAPAADAFVHTESWIDAAMEAAAAAGGSTAATPRNLDASATAAKVATTLDAAGNAEAASVKPQQGLAGGQLPATGAAPAVTALDVSRRAYDLASRTDPRVTALVSPPPPAPPSSTRASDAAASGGSANGMIASGGAAGQTQAAPAPSPAFLASLRSYLRYIAGASVVVPLSFSALEPGSGLGSAAANGAAESGAHGSARISFESAMDSQPQPAFAPQLRLFPIRDDTFPITAEAQAAALAALQRIETLLSAASAAINAASAPPGLGQDTRRELQRAAAVLRQQLGLPSPAPAVAPAPAGEEGSSSQLLSPAAVAAVLASPPAAAAAAVHAVSAGVVADIDILADIAALVGTGLSQVSRTAYEVAAARGAALLPPIALDADSLRSLPLPHPYAILAPWRAAVSSGSGN